jgi:hypothetical protein
VFSGRTLVVEEVNFPGAPSHILEAELSADLQQLQTVVFIHDSAHLP